MENTSGLPETLQQVILHFSNPDNVLAFAMQMRWPDGKATCPRCNSQENCYLATRRVWECKGCKKQFSVKQGSIFEDSHLGLDKWIIAMWMLADCKNGISSYEVSRALAISQKAAWFVLHRIRLAMQARSFDKKLCGAVEADETFVGGKVENMHLDKQARRVLQGKGGRGPKGKAIVMGLLERHGEARVKVVPTRKKKDLQSMVREHVEPKSALYTDALKSYDGLGEYAHEVIDHTEAYVRDTVVHTNGLENFWSLFKRTLKGTYVSVEAFHLQAYADEQAFRFNNRKANDLERFVAVASGVVGKRITFAELTGKGLDQATS